MKSSFSKAKQNCVDVSIDTQTGRVVVRHSRQMDRPGVLFTPSEWGAFIAGVEAGEFGYERLAEMAGSPAT